MHSKEINYDASFFAYNRQAGSESIEKNLVILLLGTGDSLGRRLDDKVEFGSDFSILYDNLKKNMYKSYQSQLINCKAFRSEMSFPENNMDVLRLIPQWEQHILKHTLFYVCHKEVSELSRWDELEARSEEDFWRIMKAACRQELSSSVSISEHKIWPFIFDQAQAVGLIQLEHRHGCPGLDFSRIK